MKFKSASDPINCNLFLLNLPLTFNLNMFLNNND